MSKRLNEQQAFEVAFKIYYRRKKPQGSADLRNDPGYVSDIALDYYQAAIGTVYAKDFRAFFKWLAETEQFFADDFVFKRKVREWGATRIERKKEGELPEEFEQYVNLYGFLASSVHVKEAPGNPECLYHKIDTICANLPALHQYRKGFIGLSEKGCFARFFEWLRQAGVLPEHLERMELEMQKFNDEVARARASGNAMEYCLRKLNPKHRQVVKREMQG